MNTNLKGVVYCYTSPSNKKYIGQTVRESRRKSDHKLAYSNNPFHNAVKKYGFENMFYETLHVGISTIEELNILEEKEIKKHGSIVPNGYNLKSGGENNLLHENTKEKIRQKAYGRKISEETRQKLRDSHLGKKQTPESIEKTRKALLGLYRGPGFSAKMKKIRNTPEMKEAVRKVHLGRKRTGKALDNIREGHWSQKILCITTGAVFNSIKEASEATGINTTSIAKDATGQVIGRKYRWKYVS